MRDTFNKKTVIRVNFSLALLIARFVSRFQWNFFLSKQAKILADQGERNLQKRSPKFCYLIT